MASVESLLAEVPHHLASRLALMAAEQIFFGDAVLYGHHSNEGPSFSKGGATAHHQEHPQGGKAKGNKKEKGKKGHHEHEHGIAKDQDGLHAAIAKTKETIEKALKGGSGLKIEHSRSDEEILKLKAEIAGIKKENAEIRAEVAYLRRLCEDLIQKETVKAEEPKKAEQAAEDEDFDLFGSSDEEIDEEKERIKQERLKAYAEKKAKKPAAAAKSSVILDIKPWDDETDLAEMEKLVRAIQKDGLVWGGAKLIPLAYGIKKLQIVCVIEDEKVSVDDLIEKITEDISDFVQSVDIVAFNKI